MDRRGKALAMDFHYELVSISILKGREMTDIITIFCSHILWTFFLKKKYLLALDNTYFMQNFMQNFLSCSIHETISCAI